MIVAIRKEVVDASEHQRRSPGKLGYMARSGKVRSSRIDNIIFAGVLVAFVFLVSGGFRFFYLSSYIY